MKEQKLRLDKESLTRLQHDQLASLTGGTDWESNTDKPDVPEVDGLAVTGGESCCSKSCNK